VALAALSALATTAAAVAAGTAPPSTAPRFVSMPAANAVIDFGVHLPLRNETQLEALVALQSNPKSPMYRHWLTPAQFRSTYGPAPATVASIEAALRANGFTITKADTQLLHVRGTVASVQKAFKVQLGNVPSTLGGTRLAPRQQLTIPKAISAAGATVVSLGYRPLPKPHSQLVPQNRYSAAGGYWFDDLKQAYDYPSYAKLDGTGVTIATVGYSDFSSSDAADYFGYERLGGYNRLGPAPVPQHMVFPQSIAFNPDFGVGDEADLDVQQANGSAPGATVIGMAAPATDAEGFLYVYSYIVDSNAADLIRRVRVVLHCRIQFRHGLHEHSEVVPRNVRPG
jgi:subtilase family serine protease